MAGRLVKRGRGRPKVFDIHFSFGISQKQQRALERHAQAFGVPAAEIVRGLIDVHLIGAEQRRENAA